MSRMTKLKKVVKYAPSYKYLNVCLEDGDNCGKCEKCVRTLLGIDALGALDNYAEVFDIDYYRKHKKWYLQQMLIQMVHNKHDYFEIYNYKKKDMSLLLYVYKGLYKMAYIGRIIADNIGITKLVKLILKR